MGNAQRRPKPLDYNRPFATAKVHGDLPPGRGVVPNFDYLREIHDLGYD